MSDISIHIATGLTVQDLAATGVELSHDTVHTVGYSDPREGGVAQWVRDDDADPARPGVVETVGGQIWRMVPINGAVDVLAFGAERTFDESAVGGLASCADALEAAIDFASFDTDKADTKGAGARVVIPRGFYYCDRTIEVRRNVHIVGSMGYENGGCEITFAPDTAGFIFHDNDTTGTDTAEDPDDPATSSAYGVTVENLSLRGDPSDDTFDEALSGILIRTHAMLRNVRVTGFKGHGVAVLAGFSGDHQGNANQCAFEYLSCSFNRGSGLWLKGVDTNACLILYPDMIRNHQWGIADHSFLGNQVFGGHFTWNGQQGPKKAGCYYNGDLYIATPKVNVDASVEQALVDTQPGTDETVWMRFYDSNGLATDTGPSSEYPEWTGGDPVGTFLPGGDICATNTNARGLFVGPYFETGHYPVVIGDRCVLREPSSSVQRWAGDGIVANTDGWESGTLNMGRETSIRFGELAHLIPYGMSGAGQEGLRTRNDWFGLMRSNATWGGWAVKNDPAGSPNASDFGRDLGGLKKGDFFLPYLLLRDWPGPGCAITARNDNGSDRQFGQGDLVINSTAGDGVPWAWRYGAENVPGTQDTTPRALGLVPTLDNALTLPTHTTAELEALTAAEHAGTLVRCADGDAGAECLAFCDGTGWFRISLGAPVQTA